MSDTKDTQSPEDTVVQEEGQVERTDVEETTPQQEDSLPKDTSDRTKEQFDKLKEKNKELNEVNKQYQSLMDSLIPEPEQQQTPQPQQQPQQKDYSHLEQDDIDQVFQSMIDDKGFLDGNKLKDTLRNMNEAAKAANERAKRVEEHVMRETQARERAIKDEKTRSLHDKYPMLDPENKDEFDRDFYEAVRNDMVGQYMNGVAPGQEDPVASADKLAKRYLQDTMNKQEQEQKERGEQARAHVNTTRPRSRITKGYYEQDGEDVLIDAVRKGKKGALGELLKRRGQ